MPGRIAAHSRETGGALRCGVEGDALLTRQAALPASQRLYVGLLPGPHPAASGVEDALVVALADLEARLGGDQRPHRVPEVVHPQLRRLIRRRHVVSAEEEAVGVAVEDFGHAPLDIGA